jgi:glycosyltransferase involved in cell wall biosynthesis
MPIKVLIVQPVLPHYRVPLFAALAAIDDFSLTVAASPKFPGTPNSISGAPAWADLSHPCSSLGQQIFWQHSLRLPADMGAGDVLVFNGNPRILSNLPLFLQARRRRIGTLWWGHGWSSSSVAWRARIRYRLMRQADAVLLYTDAEVCALRAMLPEWRRPLFALNNTIDTAPSVQAALKWPKDRLDRFRSGHDLSGARLLLFCGRLRSVPPTELEVALRAFAELYTEDSRWRMAIVGDGEERARLQRLGGTLGINAGLLWPGAIYDEQELAPWFLCADALVNPGAIGLSLLHAFSYGLPVVTHSDQRRHGPEIAALIDGRNGLLFARADARDLARQLRTLCLEPDTGSRMRAAARETIMTTFGFEAMVGRFAEAIRSAAFH